MLLNSSKEKESFEAALVDVDNLLRFHEKEGGSAPGRRHSDLSSLNKSAIVLLCSAWETYVEYVIREAANSDISNASHPQEMLRSIRKLVSDYLSNAKDGSTWENAAGDGWRELSISVVERRIGILNTPKKRQVSELFKIVIGIKEIEKNWYWRKNPLGGPSKRLDKFVSLRGAISHGEVLERNIRKVEVTNAKDLISRLVNAIEERIHNDGYL